MTTSQSGRRFKHSFRNSIPQFGRTAAFLVLLAGMGSCHQHSKQTVTVKYLRDQWIPPGELPAVEALSAEFARKTGIEMESVRGVPAETLDQLSLIRRLLQQGAEGPDVIEIDETWLGTLKDDLTDLTPYFSDVAHSISPALESSYVIGGKLVAIPFQNHVGVLGFRADLLRKYGFEHRPATWTELEKMARRIQEGERARGNRQFWGYIWPGAAAESLTCNALEWQVDEGGGTIIESDGTISVNNPAAIRAWQRARHWIGWISPPSVTEYREQDAVDEFKAGRSAFIRVWAAEPGRSSTPQNPNLEVIVLESKSTIGDVGITAMPAGSRARTGVLGGLGLGISRYSKHPQEDAVLIQFLLQRELQSFQNDEIHPITRESVVYYAAEGRQSNEVSSNSDTSRPVVIARPSQLAPHVYEQVSKAYFLAVHSVLTGEKNASDAASQLENDLVGITGLRRGHRAGK